MSLPDQLNRLTASVRERLASGTDPESLRVAVLGRKGELGVLMRQVGALPAEERGAAGAAANAAKEAIASLLGDGGAPTVSGTADATVPAYPAAYGSIHPVSAMIDEICGIFEGLSFEVVEGDELVTDWDNFGSVNFSPDHPARDAHDTLYVTATDQLRTHTSALQVRELARRVKAGRLPVRFVVPGKTFRRDAADATHSPMFHQVEGVMVDTQTTFADMKGTLDYVARRLFGNQVETRFRTHYFPFTEPSAEIDIRNKDVDGAGTKGPWIEWLGCGMIHPNVLTNAGINPKVYQGWAFGMGVERPAMIRKGLSDLRPFFENDVRFLDQFQTSV